MTNINLPDNFKFPYSWVHVIEQPPPNMQMKWLVNGKKLVFYKEASTINQPRTEQDNGDWHIKLPFVVGDVVGCRETWDGLWGAHSKAYFSIVYKSDGYEAWRKWHSPVTIPREAIRKWLKVTRIDVKRVQDYATNFMEADLKLPVADSYLRFINWFNSHYAKPRPVRENGKIVGYKCYPYSIKSMAWDWFDEKKHSKHFWMGTEPLKDRTYTWKGLPLKIIPNPFVLISTGEECGKPCM